MFRLCQFGPSVHQPQNGNAQWKSTTSLLKLNMTDVEVDSKSNKTKQVHLGEYTVRSHRQTRQQGLGLGINDTIFYIYTRCISLNLLESQSGKTR